MTPLADGRTSPPIQLVSLVQTCSACPDQWEGETADGRGIYLRHRHGYGYVSIGPTVEAAICSDESLHSWEGPNDGFLASGQLEEVLTAAGFTLPDRIAYEDFA
jgi:hypothetical protein